MCFALNHPHLVLALDGSALINTMHSRISKTFEEYVLLEVVPKVNSYSCTYTRTDIVLDVYTDLLSTIKARHRR
jgi:hypothetical protein